MYQAAAIGELLIDFAMTGSNDAGYPCMSANPGGAPANYLAALNKYGISCSFIGKVGTDSFGRLLGETLEKLGIGTEGLVRSDEYFTTLAFVSIDERGEREFSFARKHGADVMLNCEELRTELLDGAKLLHFGTLSLCAEPVKSATEKLIEYAEKKGLLLSFDPNLRKPLWADLEEAKKQMLFGLEKADIVKISDEEAEFLWGIEPEKAAEKILRDFGVKLVFVTCGGEGAVYANKNAMGRVSALKGIKTVDTTGAGDIFGGSAASRILKLGKAPDELSGEELFEICSFACTAAGLSTTKAGGIYSVPEEAEVIEYMKNTH